MCTRVRSFSKINLGLAIGPIRPDSFHALTTLYQTLALHDVVTVTARRALETRITLTANHPAVPRSHTNNAEKNTAYRMVAAALQRMEVTAEVAIDIRKNLPVQGGLGAGSANAAAALIGLEHQLGSSLAGPDRLTLAAEVGSDVPLFLLGGSILGLGRGEEVYPLPDMPAMACVVAVPSVGVSTPAAFRAIDARAANSLTSSGNLDRLKQLSRALSAAWVTSGDRNPRETKVSEPSEEKEPGPSGITRQPGDRAENPLLALVRTGIENDFEEVVFHEHPSLRSTKRQLVGDLAGIPEGSRALYAALSGSGSALFGLYRSTADARAAQQRVQLSGTQALLTETLPRAAYWNTMLDS